MRQLYRGVNLLFVVIIGLSGSVGMVRADPMGQGDIDLESLAASVAADNLAWENITFWDDVILGDESMAELMLAVEIGSAFPDISLDSLSGESLIISADGKPMLINFWASWCGPCRQELPILLAAHDDPQTPFDVVFANVWDEESAYRDFVQDEFPKDAVVGMFDVDAMPSLGLSAVPVTVLLDADHTLQIVHVGNVTQSVMDFFYAVTMDLTANRLPGINLGDMATPNRTLVSADSMLPALQRANQASGSVTLWAGGEAGVDGGHFHGIQVGEKFPAFGLVATNGETVLLDRIDRPVLLNFWASWCGPCVAEFPILIAAHEDSEADYDVVFVNIWDDPYSYQEFLAEYPDALTVVQDVDGGLPDLYGLDFIPMNFLVNEMGIVELIQYGPVNDVVMDFIALVIGE